MSSLNVQMNVSVSRRAPRPNTDRISLYTVVLLLCGFYTLVIFYGENPVGHMWRAGWRLFCIGCMLACVTRDIRGSVGAI